MLWHGRGMYIILVNHLTFEVVKFYKFSNFLDRRLDFSPFREIVTLFEIINEP